MPVLATIAVALIGLLTPAAALGPGDFHRDGYLPRSASATSSPYNDSAVLSAHETGIVDVDGVRMIATGDGQLHNHPVAQAQYGLSLLNSYRLTNNPWFLERALRQAQRLADRHVESRGAWFLPYDFDFNLNTNPDDTLHNPWYSGMAEGQALSLFSRLASETGDPIWRSAADGVFAAFMLPSSGSDPWVSMVDSDGYLWLEEYPRTPETTSEHVYNGLMFAAFGVWDYWQLTASDDAAALFDGAATTVVRYFPSIRNAGWASNYSLRGHTPHTRYHGIHIRELLFLNALTDSPVFARLAETLQSDYPTAAQRGTVLFARGTHTGFQFDSSGRVTARKSVKLKRASSAPATQRTRILLHGSYWYRITSGSLANYWVTEVPRIRTMRGVVGRINYLVERTVTLPGGTAAHASAYAWINGTPCVLISDGASAGRWAPLTAGTTLN